MKSFEQIAKAMFYTFAEYQGYHEEEWDEQPQFTKDAWYEAARAAYKEITEVH